MYTSYLIDIIILTNVEIRKKFILVKFMSVRVNVEGMNHNI